MNAGRAVGILADRGGSPRLVAPAAVESLQPFVDAGVFSEVEVHLAAWVQRASAVDHPYVALAVASAAWAARHGHVCADLHELAAAVQHELADIDTVADLGADVDHQALLEWPPVHAWLQALYDAPSVVRVVESHDALADGVISTPPDGTPLDTTPLVLHGQRVYLQRHWFDECLVAESLRRRAVGEGGTLTPTATTLLDALLPARVAGAPNLQRVAADTVVAHPFAVIVGGPGTGKTYSVARMLAVLMQQALDQGRHLRVALAAPTGKAAARLHESITVALSQPDLQAHASAEVLQALASATPTTIHRLLGSQAGRRQRFRHDAVNPLPHDVVVVDETSMVSLPLLARLVEAVRPDARVVLIGDPDQLESVELGAVLGDIVHGSHAGPLAGRVVRLLRGHRFEGDSPIAQFADAVRGGDAREAMRLLHLPPVLDLGGSMLRFVDTVDPTSVEPLEAVREMVQPVLTEVRRAAEAGDAAEALRRASTVRILCAHRHGRFGVSEWNRIGEQWLVGPHVASPGAWYAGRLLLVTRNDVRLGLSNGDTGVVIRRSGRLVAAFASARGVVELEPAQLDAVDTAFAMTVHKSQGSEYRTVVMVLPPASSPLVGRELLYTGVTRAQQHLLLVGDDAAVRSSIDQPATRMTGLADTLSGR